MRNVSKNSNLKALTIHGAEYINTGKSRHKNTMITKDNILRILIKDMPQLQKQFKVSKLALFGSYARGDQHRDSDIDILVEVDPSIGLEFVTLAERLEKSLKSSVDLVSSRAVSSHAFKLIEPELIYV
jgi:hypothetical protein